MVHHDLVKKVFLPKREDCLEYLQKIKWKGTVRCPYCCSSDGWKYLNFGKGKVISTDSPGHIKMAFNEIEYLLAWKE